MTESITPEKRPVPEIHYQGRLPPNSMLSVPSSANTVAPEEQGPNSAQQPPKRGARRKLWFFAALSAVAGVATVSALHDRAPIVSDVRSGSPGFRKASTGKNMHWEKKALTIYLDDSLQRLGPGANEAVMQAFGQWVASDTRLPDLTFDTGKAASSTPKQDGKSTVSYGRITAAGHEQNVAITVTYANDKTGEIIEADIILNSLYPMGVLTAKAATQAAGSGTSNDDDKDGKSKDAASNKSMKAEAVDCQNRYDAQNVATHEVGHFFGLGEDMTEHQATMFLSIDQCETHKRVLQTTDVGAIGTLYAASADPQEAQAGPRACSFGSAPAGGAFCVSSAIFGLSLLRRRRAR